jgi:hypothetical protein
MEIKNKKLNFNSFEIENGSGIDEIEMEVGIGIENDGIEIITVNGDGEISTSKDEVDSFTNKLRSCTLSSIANAQLPAVISTPRIQFPRRRHAQIVITSARNIHHYRFLNFFKHQLRFRNKARLIWPNLIVVVFSPPKNRSLF